MGQGQGSACAALYPRQYRPTKALVSSMVDKQICLEKFGCDNDCGKPGQGLGNHNTQLLARSNPRTYTTIPNTPTQSDAPEDRIIYPVAGCRKHRGARGQGRHGFRQLTLRMVPPEACIFCRPKTWAPAQWTRRRKCRKFKR